MALPSSGELSMRDINAELGRTSTALIGLDEAENGVYATINTNSAFRPDPANPASISEWYRYNHTAGPAFSCTFDAGQIVTAASSTIRGFLSITGIPGALTLCAYGGNSGRGGTEAYFDLDGGTILGAFAGPFTEICDGPLTFPPNNYSYRLYAFIAGTGGSADISCAQ